MIAAAWLYQAKLVVFLAGMLVLYIGRICEANLIKRVRTDKRDWIFSGVLMGLQVGTLFLFNSWIWLTSEFILILIQLAYLWFNDQQKDLKGMIIHSEVIYEDHYIKNDQNVDSETKAQKEARDKRVKNYILFTRFSFVMGVPVFAHKFSCKRSTTVKADAVSALMQQINRTYGNDYTWEQSASPNMKYIWFICALKGKTKFILPFDKKLSDSLPWYAIPMGVTDPGNPSQSRPFVWFLDDPKKEKVEFPQLKDATLTPMAPQTFLVGSSGGGKANKCSTPIFTLEDGQIKIKRMGELKVGDTVFNRNGKAVKVSGVYPQGKKDAYEVIMRDGRSVIASADHMFISRTLSHGHIKEKVFETQEMIERGVEKENGAHDFAIPRPKPLRTSDVDLPLDPWLLGYLIGNGCFTQNSAVQVSTADKFIVDTLCKKALLLDCEIYKRSKYHYNFIPYRPLRDKLEKLGLWGHYSYTKFIPQIYMQAGFEQRLALFQGLMDSDGYCEKSGKGLQFSTTSKRLADDVLQLGITLGFCGQITLDERDKYQNSEGKAYRVRFTGRPLCPFTLPRKKERWGQKDKKPTMQVLHYSTQGTKLDWVAGYLTRIAEKQHNCIVLYKKNIALDTQEEIIMQLPLKTFMIGPWVDGNYALSENATETVETLDIDFSTTRAKRVISERYLGNLSYLQGLIDACAKYNEATGQMRLHISSDAKPSVLALLDSFSLVYKTYQRGAGHTEIILDNVPSDIVAIADTKAAILRFEEGGTLTRKDYMPIVAIKNLHRKEDMVCIKVDDPTHSYTLANGIVSHNSSLLKVFLSHFVPIAKKDKSFKIYLADGKSVEFTPFKELEEVSSVTTTLEDLAKQTDEFVAEMLHMEHCMGVEGNMNQLPLDNHINLKKTVILNGHMFLNDEEFEYKDLQGNIKKDKAVNLVGRDDISEINIPDFAPEEDEEKRGRGMW